MPLNSGNVRVAGTGALWKAPLGTALPTDSTTAWGAGFVNLGYATDGFTLTQDLKKQDITAWQTLSPVRSIATGLIRKLAFEAIESNVNTVPLAWGGATLSLSPGTSLGTVTVAITTGVLTVSATHGLNVGDAVQLQGVSGGAPLASNTTYYVQSVPTSTTLTLALTSGGAAIATTTSGTASGIIKVTGAYSLSIPEGQLTDFILGVDWSDGAVTQRIIVQQASILTLPTIKFVRTDAVRYPLEVQAIAPADGTKSILVYGVDRAVAGA